jgi:hypothetical protein
VRTDLQELETRLRRALHDAAEDLEIGLPPGIVPGPAPRRARPGLLIGGLALLSTAIVVALALAVRPSGHAGSAAGTPGSILHYTAVETFHPAAGAGASFRVMTTRIEVWLYGDRAHVLEWGSFDGRPGLIVEETVNGDHVRHYQSGDQLRRGEIDEGSWPSRPGVCFELTLCGPGLPLDPRAALQFLLRRGDLRWAAHARVGGRLVELALATGHHLARVLVDPRTGVPEQISDTFGSRPWPAAPLDVITLTGYDRVPATAQNLARLRMEAHPGARIVPTAPGSPP